MRIIRDLSEEIEKKVVCVNCGVEIGYLPNDIREEKHTDYVGDVDFYKVIDCPKCKKVIQLN